jgi:demethylmenaquinone methyltransferase/2-methoxy-6-polyprenyl-1,4-benzoquinol methylase
MREQPTHEGVRRAYDRLARWYDLITLGQEDAARKAALDLLALRPGERVLEVGFGTGRALAAIARAVSRQGTTCGIDLSPAMAQVAKRSLRAREPQPQVHLACGDALYLPFANGGFDALFLSFTLELLETDEMPAALAECRRVLRRDGRLGAVCLSSGAGQPAINRLYLRAHVRWPHTVDCRPIRPQEVLAGAGFETRASRAMSLWGLGVEALVALPVRGERARAF